MKTNDFGIDLIKQFEGLVDGDPKTPGLDPYICPTGYVTQGYGRVLRDRHGNMLRGREGLAVAKTIYSPIDEPTANVWLEQDIVSFEADVLRMLQGVTLNENQFSALVSLVFNIGAGNFQRSTLRRLLREGNFEAAANEFPRWNKGDVNGDGKLEALPGLTRRREAERQLFLRPVKPLSKSRTIIASSAAVAATTASVIAEVTTEIAQTSPHLQTLTGTEMDIIKYILAGLAIAGSLFAIYARVSDRLRKGH